MTNFIILLVLIFASVLIGSFIGVCIEYRQQLREEEDNRWYDDTPQRARDGPEERNRFDTKVERPPTGTFKKTKE